MRFTALQSTGMHTAIPLSGANAVGIGLAARPALPSCREPHDLPDAPLSNCFDLFNHLRSTLRLSLGRSKMSLYEKTYVILTMITFLMVLSCLAHLDEDL